MTDPTAKLLLELWAKIFDYLEPDPHAGPDGKSFERVRTILLPSIAPSLLHLQQGDTQGFKTLFCPENGNIPNTTSQSA